MGIDKGAGKVAKLEADAGKTAKKAGLKSKGAPKG